MASYTQGIAAHVSLVVKSPCQKSERFMTHEEIAFVEYEVARARYPPGHRWGITVIPHLGQPQTGVMPQVGARPGQVMWPHNSF